MSCDFGIFFRQLRANSRVHILSLLRGGRKACTDGPNRLISDHRIGKSGNTERVDDTAQLTLDNFECLARLTLFKGFPDAEHWLQTAGLGGCKLLLKHFLAFANDLATLRMTYQHQLATQFSQLTRSNFPSQRALFGLYCRILCTYGDSTTLERIDYLTDVQRRRKYRNFDLTRLGQLP